MYSFKKFIVLFKFSACVCVRMSAHVDAHGELRLQSPDGSLGAELQVVVNHQCEHWEPDPGPLEEWQPHKALEWVFNMG